MKRSEILATGIFRNITKWSTLGIILLCFAAFCLGQRRSRPASQRIVLLPAPRLTGPVSLEDALAKRRSIRQFSGQALEHAQIGQLAWAGQGITEPQRGLRTAPSAGESYPIELYFATPEGLFIYRPPGHSFEQISDRDVRGKLAAAASMQESVARAGCDIIVAGSMRKLTGRFRTKAKTYMHLEAGHVAQNIQLQAVCLDLGSVTIGGFDARDVRTICRLPRDMEPIYIICVGYPAAQEPKEKPQEPTGAVTKKAALIVASENFGDEELFETRRVLEAASVQTTIASTRMGIIRGMLGNIAEARILVDQLKVDDYDAIIFIGGPGAIQYVGNRVTSSIAREAVRKEKVLAAIGVAPTLLADAGVLKGVRTTSYLTERERLVQAGATYTGAPVERDKFIITATGPAAASQFAKAIADALAGK